MKPGIDIYLSEQMLARLAMAADRAGETKSALVEAALERFLGHDADDEDKTTLAWRVTQLTRQIDHLNRELGIVSETVSLHARFHLAVAPVMPARMLEPACRLGSERFEEFAAQVRDRIHRRTPLMHETIDQIDTAGKSISSGRLWESDSTRIEPATDESCRSLSAGISATSDYSAAVRRDGSHDHFRAQTCRILH